MQQTPGNLVERIPDFAVGLSKQSQNLQDISPERTNRNHVRSLHLAIPHITWFYNNRKGSLSTTYSLRYRDVCLKVVQVCSQVGKRKLYIAGVETSSV